MKKRIDLRLVEAGLAPTRERAQALILSGNVLVNDVPVTKPGEKVDEAAPIRVRGADHPSVSRGGVKLAAAMDAFGVQAGGRTAMDIGASTGGFTQVLLLRGAARVLAVDVGHSQLDSCTRAYCPGPSFPWSQILAEAPPPPDEISAVRDQVWALADQAEALGWPWLGQAGKSACALSKQTK